MRRMHHCAMLATIAVLSTLAGCGGVVLSTSKQMLNPLGLQGRSASADAVLTVSGLTTRITADRQNALQFTLSDQTVSGNPYEGMSQMEITQRAVVLMSVASSGSLPSTITLRDVNLNAVVHVSEGTRTSTPVQFRYAGFLTLDRQPDGSYKAREPLVLSHTLDRFEGSALIAMLISGGANTVTCGLTFTADTSSPNIPEGSAVRVTLQFDAGNATVRW